jgi:hypothetical protein
MSCKVEDVNHAFPHSPLFFMRRIASVRLDLNLLVNRHRLDKRSRAAVLGFDGTPELVCANFVHFCFLRYFIPPNCAPSTPSISPLSAIVLRMRFILSLSLMCVISRAFLFLIDGFVSKYFMIVCSGEARGSCLIVSMKRFARLTLGFSKKIENLRAAVNLHFAHYNFVRLHRTLRVTPAMAAGVENRVWDLRELVGPN